MPDESPTDPHGARSDGPIQALIYVRVRTADPIAGAADRLAQIDVCTDFVEGRGWKVATVVASGAGMSNDRRALTRLWSIAASGRVDVVVIERVDRLTRRASDFDATMRGLDRLGIEFVAIAEGADSTTHEGRQILWLLQRVWGLAPSDDERDPAWRSPKQHRF